MISRPSPTSASPAKMKKLAEAGPDRICDEVSRTTAEGRRPSRNRLLDAIPIIASCPKTLLVCLSGDA